MTDFGESEGCYGAGAVIIRPNDIELMLNALREIEGERERLEQIADEHQQGMVETRLAESILEALSKVKHLTQNTVFILTGVE